MAFAKASESTFGIAKLVGEGFGRPNAIDESPIDIQYGKLAEWLVRMSWMLSNTPEVHCKVKLPACREPENTCQLTGESA